MDMKTKCNNKRWATSYYYNETMQQWRGKRKQDVGKNHKQRCSATKTMPSDWQQWRQQSHSHSHRWMSEWLNGRVSEWRMNNKKETHAHTHIHTHKQKSVIFLCFVECNKASGVTAHQWQRKRKYATDWKITFLLVFNKVAEQQRIQAPSGKLAGRHIPRHNDRRTNGMSCQSKQLASGSCCCQRPNGWMSVWLSGSDGWDGWLKATGKRMVDTQLFSC